MALRPPLTPEFLLLRQQSGSAAADPTPYSLGTYPLASCAGTFSEELLVYWSGDKVANSDTITFKALHWDSANSAWVVGAEATNIPAHKAFPLRVNSSPAYIVIVSVSVTAATNVAVWGAAILPPPMRLLSSFARTAPLATVIAGQLQRETLRTLTRVDGPYVVLPGLGPTSPHILALDEGDRKGLIISLGVISALVSLLVSIADTPVVSDEPVASAASFAASAAAGEAVFWSAVAGVAVGSILSGAFLSEDGGAVTNSTG